MEPRYFYFHSGAFGGGYGGGYGGGGFVGGNQGFGMGGGMGGGFGFNRWGNTGMNYQTMNGFTFVDYSGGWNAAVHDQMLRNNIDLIFMKYDMNRSGQLEGQ